MSPCCAIVRQQVVTLAGGNRHPFCLGLVIAIDTQTRVDEQIPDPARPHRTKCFPVKA